MRYEVYVWVTRPKKQSRVVNTYRGISFFGLTTYDSLPLIWFVIHIKVHKFQWVGNVQGSNSANKHLHEQALNGPGLQETLISLTFHLGTCLKQVRTDSSKYWTEKKTVDFRFLNMLRRNLTCILNSVWHCSEFWPHNGHSQHCKTCSKIGCSCPPSNGIWL